MSPLPLLIVLLPFLGALAVALFAGGRRRAGVRAGVVLPATVLALALLLWLVPEVAGGGRPAFRADWLPAAGLSLSFAVDGLGLLMAGLILAIGVLILIYALAYMPPGEGPRLAALLLLFQGAMLGVVLSDNILLLLLFWEITSLASFLLIAFRPEGAGAARVALVVTSGGGLALMAGLLLLGQAAGSYELSEILTRGEAVRASPLYGPLLALILIGAFAKSAQVPLHFWLPAAMAAPTPVSAYLHSATMVKAGVFLLARLWPVLSGTEAWTWTVTGFGLATFAFGAITALNRSDLKSLLAYSTVSHLGLMTLLLGLGTAAAATAAVLHLLAHALFKAALFMTAGLVEHGTGRREFARLSGLASAMPLTAGIMTVAALAMAGMPPTGGFLSKEAALDAAFAAGTWLPVVLAAASALSCAYALRLLAPFRGALPEGLHPHPPGPALWAAPAGLAALVLLLGLFPMTFAGGIVALAASAVTGTVQHPHLTLWHGFTPALGLSMAALAGGVALAVWRPGGWAGPGWQARLRHERLVASLTALAARLAEAGTRRPLELAACGLLVACLVAGIAAFASAEFAPGLRTQLSTGGLMWASWLVLVVTAAATLLWRRQRFLALLLSGLPGLVVAFWFATLSAPDLAITQVAVEVAAVVLLLLALARLGEEAPKPRRRRPVATGLSLAAGLAFGLLAFALMIRDPALTGFPSLSEFFMAQSLPGGGGRNVVNVILVDFRGFDTWGEITVLAIAALTVQAALAGVDLPAGRGAPMPFTGEATIRVLVVPALVVATYLFLRGHHAPGGGFSSGLVVAVATLTPALVSSGLPGAWEPRRLIAAGLLAAGATGIAAWAFGFPFLTSAHGHVHLAGLDIELASAMAFDAGVFLTVLGATRLMLGRLAGRR